jgi:hypothetical protein
MFNLLLLAALTATLLALPAAASYVLPVDNLQAIKITLHGYGTFELYRIEQEPNFPDARFQSLIFQRPVPE